MTEMVVTDKISGKLIIEHPNRVIQALGEKLLPFLSHMVSPEHLRCVMAGLTRRSSSMAAQQKVAALNEMLNERCAVMAYMLIRGEDAGIQTSRLESVMREPWRDERLLGAVDRMNGHRNTETGVWTMWNSLLPDGQMHSWMSSVHAFIEQLASTDQETTVVNDDL